MWFRKFSGFLLVSLGISLLFLKLPGQLMQERQVETLFVTVDAYPYTLESAKEQFGEEFINSQEGNQDSNPGFYKAVLDLLNAEQETCIPAEEWKSLMENWGTDMKNFIFPYRDGIFKTSISRNETEVAGQTLICFNMERLGYFDNQELNPMVHLTVSELNKFPDIKAQLQDLATAPDGTEKELNIPIATWHNFHHDLFSPDHYAYGFVAFDRFFSGHVVNLDKTVGLPLPWLPDTARVFGAIFCVLGVIFLMTGLSFSKKTPGIPIAPAWLTLFFDLICMASGTFLVAVVLDAIWVGPLAQKSLIGLEPEWLAATPITGLHFVSLLGLVLAFPLFTLWTTSLTGQKVQVQSDGITVFGAIFLSHMSWEEITSFSFTAQRNPFAFTVTDFRKLQKVLEIEGDKGLLIINEPASQSRKQRILTAIKQQIPQEKKDLLIQLEGPW